MIIECPGCQTQFYLDENKLSQAPLKLRCSQCQKVFTSTLPQPTKPLAEKQSAQKAPSESAQAKTGPVRKVATTGSNSLPNKKAGGGPGPIIAISNQKGGVAKTSTCLNLGMALAAMQKRVLLVDFDIQGNLTSSLGERSNTSLYNAAQKEKKNLGEIISRTQYANVWLLPSNPKMALLSRKKVNGYRPMHILNHFLADIRKDFDFILVDTPPSIEFFTLNALIASDFIIIPSQCESFSIHGVGQMEKAIHYIRKKEARGIDYRVLITMYDAEKTAARVVHENIMNRYKERAFGTVIEMDDKVSESQIVGQPVVFYDPESRVAGQYKQLAEELLAVPVKTAAGGNQIHA